MRADAKGEIPGIETVMLTTNGVLLKEALPELLLAGIDGKLPGTMDCRMY